MLPGALEIDYEYDLDGRLVALTPPGRPAHRFEYTATGVELVTRIASRAGKN